MTIGGGIVAAVMIAPGAIALGPAIPVLFVAAAGGAIVTGGATAGVYGVGKLFRWSGVMKDCTQDLDELPSTPKVVL